MINILFGPDGVGKTTVAQNWEGRESPPIVLHGTNMHSWFDKHADLLHDHRFDTSHIPPTEAFADRIALLNAASLALSASGLSVVIDGHSLHKTLINVAAGRTEAPGLSRGTPLRLLLNGPLKPRIGELLGGDITHRHIVLDPTRSLAEDAAELQRRLTDRLDYPGGTIAPSPWDPQTAVESQTQLQKSYELEGLLRSLGAVVLQESSPDLS